MTYSTYEINTPSPYLVLSKNDKIPVVLTVGESNSNDKTGIETDVKILTAHKCQTETLITKLGSDTTDDFFVPKGFMESKLSTINEIDALKTGTLTKDSIDLLNKKVHSLASSSVPIIISADELDNETFLLAFKQITPASTLIVCSSSKAKQLLNIQKDMKTEEDAFEIANQLANETSAPNVLMTDCLENDKGSIDVFYCVADQKFVVSNGQTFAAGVDSMISAAVAANLANGFTMNESVYGAIEYTQSAIATTVTTSDDKIPNYMYAIEIPMKKMVQDECFTAHELVSVPQPLKSGPICENFFDYLIKHPLVKPYWDTYVNHEFVNQIANGTLPLKKFQFYVEQDYSYLVDYGRVHCVAGSKAPDLEDMEQELVIVGRIRVEMGQHEKRLKEEFGVKDDAYFKTIKRGPALNNYSRYFNDVAKRGNWQELVAALTPCMMGYGVAAMKHKGKVTAAKGSMYDEWIDIYSCENYENGMQIGESLLNHIARSYPQDEIERLVRIFGEVCDLETKFWDAALAYEG